MEAEVQIVAVDKPEDSVWGIIGSGLDAFNLQNAGEYHFQRLCFAAQAPEGKVIGGVLGEMYWNWLHIDILWVDEAWRGHGFGQRLLLQIEEAARQRGARHVFLDTFSFQAPGLYEKAGYRLYGELPGFPEGHTRYFYTKQL